MDILLTRPMLDAWLFVFARLLGWAWADPLMGRLPWSLRLFVAGALAWVWAPGLSLARIDPVSGAGLMSLALSFLSGAALGFAARLLVGAAEAALSLVGLTASLGLGRTVPEQNGGLDAVLRGLAWWIALLAFFSANGHLLVLQALGASFQAIPPADPGFALKLAEAGGLLLASALQLGLPLLVLVLLAQLAFAVLSRLLPAVDGYSAGLAIGAFALLGGVALAAPLLASGLAALFARQLPLLLP